MGTLWEPTKTDFPSYFNKETMEVISMAKDFKCKFCGFEECNIVKNKTTGEINYYVCVGCASQRNTLKDLSCSVISTEMSESSSK